MDVTLLFIGVIIGFFLAAVVVVLFFWLINGLMLMDEAPETDEEDLCWECTGSGWMIGDMPCKVCRGTGKIPKGQMVR